MCRSQQIRHRAGLWVGLDATALRTSPRVSGAVLRSPWSGATLEHGTRQRQGRPLRLVNASPNYGAPMNLATVCYVLVSIAAVIYILDFLGVV